jgi:phosphomannomutase
MEVCILGTPSSLVKFGTAGIRGIYGEDISIRETLAVCYAVNKLQHKGTFGVCRDTRKSSSVLSEATVAGINWFGSDVLDFGLLPTPLLAFNVKRRKLHGGFSVTASHNPAEYAGIKVFNGEGIELSLAEEHEIEEETRKANYAREADGYYGESMKVEDGVDLYLEEARSVLPQTRRRLNILVDCGNGAACFVSPYLLSKFGHRVISINSHPNASFPGRHPEPNEKTLVETSGITKVLAEHEGVDFGVAHDGDADRVVLLDRSGWVVPDYILSWAYLKMLIEEAKEGGGTGLPSSSSSSHRKEITISVNSSDAISELAEENGYRVRYARLGKTSEELYRNGTSYSGFFASEPSKIVDPKWGFWEDGIYATLRMSQYLSTNNLKLEDILKEAPRYFQEREDLQSSTVDYDFIVREGEKTLGPKFKVKEIVRIDGVKFVLLRKESKNINGHTAGKNNLEDKKGDAWLMLRNSGTERKVRIYVESKTSKEEAKQLLEIGKQVVASATSSSS